MSWQVIEKDGQKIRVAVHRDKRGTWISHQGIVTLVANDSGRQKSKQAENIIEAPMTGKIVSIEVEPGEQVEEGVVLIIMEAMKMEYRLKAPIAGQVDKVQCEAGELVDLGKTLVSLKYSAPHLK